MHRSFILYFITISFALLGCGGGSSSSNTTHNYILQLNSTEPLAGYEVHLRFTKDSPTKENFTLNNDFLATKGREVSTLGMDTSSPKYVVFGAYSEGKAEAVSGKFDVLRFQSKDSISQISISEKTCVGKDVREVDCDVEIVEGV